MREQVARTLDVLRRAGAEGALLTSPGNVTYVSGYAPPIEAGESPFAGGPVAAVIDGAGRVTLVVPDIEADAARAQSVAEDIAAYRAFAYTEPVDSADTYSAAVLAAVHGKAGQLGVEMRYLPASLKHALTAMPPPVQLREVGGTLAAARRIKTAGEIERLRRALDLTAVGQQAAREEIRPGLSEIAAFAPVKGAIEVAAGGRVPLGGDFVSGPRRTANVGGWPTSRRIEPGDLVLVDLVPRYAGYWGDSCNTLCAGEPGTEAVTMMRATTEALQRTIEAIRPGVLACAIDAVCRETVARYGYAYPHHSGHALGTTPHESPRLVPYDRTPLQVGMVLAIEPGAYVEGVGGVRTEHVVLVEEDGAQVLSTFRHGFQ